MEKESSSGFIKEKKSHDKLWGDAQKAEQWFFEEARKEKIKIPDDFPGMKSFIIQLTTIGKNEGRNPQEIAEAYLTKLKRKKGVETDEPLEKVAG